MSGTLRVHELTGGYAAGAPVLRDVSFTLPSATITAILGPNGGGKTTLIRALLDELPLRRGQVELPGACAYVPQTERTRLDFPVNALDVVLMGAYGRTPAWRRISRADRARGGAMLDRVGLADRAHERFGSLSGGQRQRVLVARALMQDATLLLLDEPLSGVDATSGARIERLLDDLRAEGRILLVATHDVRQARAWDAVLCLNGRQVAFGAPADVLDSRVLKETYGDELIVVDGNRQALTIDHHHHAH